MTGFYRSPAPCEYCGKQTDWLTMNDKYVCPDCQVSKLGYPKSQFETPSVAAFADSLATSLKIGEQASKKARKPVEYVDVESVLINGRVRKAIKRTGEHVCTIRIKNGYDNLGKPMYIRIEVVEVYLSDSEEFLYVDKVWMSEHKATVNFIRLD